MTPAALRILALASLLTTASAVQAAAQDRPRTSPGDAAARGQGATLAALLFPECSNPPSGADDGKGPRIVVTPLGRLLSVSGPINEGDSVRVVVLGRDSLLPWLIVARTSAARAPGTVAVVGQTTLTRFSEPRCAQATWTLRDFAPGTGEVEISAAWPTGKPDDNVGYAVRTLAKIGFPVRRLYSGALFFGPIVTDLRNPDFGLRALGADTIIAYTTRPGMRVEYALFYAHLLPRPRDIERDRFFRLDPLIGLVLNDVPNNLLLGGTAHLGYTLHVVGGIQIGRVRRLDTSSRLHVGDPIPDSTGTAAIPVVSRTAVGWFAGIALDLRAAGRLLDLIAK